MIIDTYDVSLANAVTWHRTCCNQQYKNPGKEHRMSPVIREFATMNVVVISLIVFVGFVFLRVVKRSMEN